MYSVYILTVPDGRKYVGTTAMPVKRRWNHGNGYRFCQPLWEIIRAVGWEAIVKEVVGCDLTENEASKLEQKLILKYRSTESGFGFNTEGGGLRSSKRVLEVTRKRQSESRTGERNCNFGRHFTEDHRKKIAESNTGLKRSPETCQRIGESKEIPVAQYTSSGMLIAVYPSAKLASVVTGAQAGHISKVCKGQRGSAAGFVWKYV